MEQKLIRQFYLIGMAEAISFLALLCIAMPLKYAAGMPAAVQITGMIHGLLFIVYLAVSAICWKRLQWPFQKLLLAGAASVIPLGPFWFHKKHF